MNRKKQIFHQNEWILLLLFCFNVALHLFFIYTCRRHAYETFLRKVNAKNIEVNVKKKKDEKS